MTDSRKPVLVSCTRFPETEQEEVLELIDEADNWGLSANGISNAVTLCCIDGVWKLRFWDAGSRALAVGERVEMTFDGRVLLRLEVHE